MSATIAKLHKYDYPLKGYNNPIRLKPPNCRIEFTIFGFLLFCCRHKKR